MRGPYAIIEEITPPILFHNTGNNSSSGSSSLAEQVGISYGGRASVYSPDMKSDLMEKQVLNSSARMFPTWLHKSHNTCTPDFKYGDLTSCVGLMTGWRLCTTHLTHSLCLCDSGDISSSTIKVTPVSLHLCRGQGANNVAQNPKQYGCGWFTVTLRFHRRLRFPDPG